LNALASASLADSGRQETNEMNTEYTFRAIDPCARIGPVQ
jgi:hypothetical protein